MAKMKNSEIQNGKKKESRYTLNSFQREVFFKKIYPTILVGSIIWLISEIVINSSSSGFGLTFQVIAFIIVMIVIFALLFVLFYFSSKANNIILSVGIYFALASVGGIFFLLIVIIVPSLSLQVHMYVASTLEGTLIVGLLCVSLRENYFAKGYIWAHVILFFIYLTLSEIVFFLIFDIRNWLLTISITLPYLCIVSLLIMFYGAVATKRMETDKTSWAFALFKILAFVLIAVFLAILIAIIVLIVISLGILGGSVDFDFSGFSSGGRKRKRKKDVETL